MLENVAHYKILERLGTGEMGEVFRARDTRLGRTVAVRVLPPDVEDDLDRRARLLRQAHAAAALSHPSIATLYEAGKDQGRLFLAFEFVPGNPLRTVIGGRPLNPRTAIQIAIQIADALADAHAAGVVHGDLKPANIVITPKGVAKVLDFGLSKSKTDGSAGDDAIDERTDIFSLGLVLWEMLTGAIAHAGVPPPSTVNAGAPAELDLIVVRMLARQKDDCYQFAATVSADLRAVATLLDARTKQAERTLTNVPRARKAAGWRGLVRRWLGRA